MEVVIVAGNRGCGKTFFVKQTYRDAVWLNEYVASSKPACFEYRGCDESTKTIVIDCIRSLAELKRIYQIYLDKSHVEVNKYGIPTFLINPTVVLICDENINLGKFIDTEIDCFSEASIIHHIGNMVDYWKRR